MPRTMPILQQSNSMLFQYSHLQTNTVAIQEIHMFEIATLSFLQQLGAGTIQHSACDGSEHGAQYDSQAKPKQTSYDMVENNEHLCLETVNIWEMKPQLLTPMTATHNPYKPFVSIEDIPEPDTSQSFCNPNNSTTQYAHNHSFKPGIVKPKP